MGQRLDGSIDAIDGSCFVGRCFFVRTHQQELWTEERHGRGDCVIPSEKGSKTGW